MGSFERQLALDMERHEAAGLRRELPDPSSAPGRVDFVSNDYLGLSRDAELVAAARSALDEAGSGGRAARLLGGGSLHHTAAEAAAAEWLGEEAALLFPSGYQANLGVLGALAGRGDVILSDERNHASLIDGARLSRARIVVHRHLDLGDVEHHLARAGGARRRLVVTEGVFSMDGDAPDLAALAALCERFDAWLVVDEAHSVGLLGPEGAGAWAAAVAGAGDAEVRSGPVARIVTGGKALGAGGALVVGSLALRNHLLQRARSFVFTTAPPPATAAALAAAITRARGMDAERARTLGAARDLAARLGAPAPAAAIVPVRLGAPETAVSAARALAEAGLDVRAVRPPTVPAGHSGLRIVVHAFNTDAELDELARAVVACDACDAVAGGVETARAHAAGSAGRDDALGEPDQIHARGKQAHATAPARPLFVAGTDTGIGKTVVSALLVRAARRLGPTAYWKPVQTGDDSDTDTVGSLSEARPHELLRPAWSLPLPASPHEAAIDAGVSIDPRRVEDGLTGLCRTLRGARLVVELAGGLFVPYRLADAGAPHADTQLDWLGRAGAPLVLVARSGLGTLNHTLLSLEALAARHLAPRALFLVGEPHPSNRATLAQLSQLAVFELAPLGELSPAALDAWLEANPLDEVLG